ncbi:ion transporter [Halococcus sp. IIIV-5B]|uniref:ion transporter n=1 Tax=Halococcus sp. IIIV-5B TaxID=2321230 RepID=UPI000E74FBEF|nr:ion transporter [Halococcus sp. IIIV-5B]RJT06482.1 ion transporter [Halococcus sp. IIIV-5B]
MHDTTDDPPPKHRLATLLATGEGGTPGQVVDWCVMALIVLNALLVMLETVGSLDAQYGHLFEAFALFSIAAFTVEYVARVWAATAGETYTRPVIGRLRYMARPYPLIDLLAIAPFYLAAALGNVDLLFLMRPIWLLRLTRLTRYSSRMQTLERVIWAKREDLSIALSGATVLLVIASSLLYYAEHDAQPEAFSSIPAALWWGIATLTTVGYGDVVPVTPLGKALAGLTMVGGVAFFALPASILASGFLEDREETPTVCPHCGERLGARDPNRPPHHED